MTRVFEGIAKYAECPFYVNAYIDYSDSSVNRLACEGNSKWRDIETFSSRAMMKCYIENICGGVYKNCPVYKSLLEKYAKPGE